MPVVLPGLGRHDPDVLVRDVLHVRKGFLPAPGWLRGFFGEFTWVLPVLHIGIIGMMILTRWWDFWTS